MLLGSPTPLHTVHFSVSVSKLFKTFLGLCHPLWIRRSWRSDDVSWPHALTVSLPLLFTVTCTILLSLLQSDLRFHYQSATPIQAFLEVLKANFFFSKSLIIIWLIKNSPASLLTDPKVSVFSWCCEDSNEVLPSFPKSSCCGKSTSAHK